MFPKRIRVLTSDLHTQVYTWEHVPAHIHLPKSGNVYTYTHTQHTHTKQNKNVPKLHLMLHKKTTQKWIVDLDVKEPSLFSRPLQTGICDMGLVKALFDLTLKVYSTKDKLTN